MLASQLMAAELCPEGPSARTTVRREWAQSTERKREASGCFALGGRVGAMIARMLTRGGRDSVVYERSTDGRNIDLR